MSDIAGEHSQHQTERPMARSEANTLTWTARATWQN